MTRKDYILIAEALKTVRDGYSPHWNANLFRACDDHAHDLADRLGRDNPRFERDRFLKACGVAS